jgi:hypothetical protein
MNIPKPRSSLTTKDVEVVIFQFWNSKRKTHKSIWTMSQVKLSKNMFFLKKIEKLKLIHMDLWKYYGLILTIQKSQTMIC